jgi:Domain of unknown function (DUF4329)
MGVVASAVLLGVFAAGTAPGAQDCGVVHTRPTPASFVSIEAAVRANATARLDDSVTFDREWVGGVLRGPDGRYSVTEGVGCRGHNTVKFTVPTTKGSELVAFWHTHGSPGIARDRFSPDDARVVLTTRREFFLMTPDGALKVLRPAHVRQPAAQYIGATVHDRGADV